MWLANLAEESGQFNRVAENLNYSAKALARTWPHRYARNPDAKERVPNELALQIAGHPEKIANLTYANRMGNGAPETGEGWLYRGRGWAQLTGKANYTRATAALGLPLLGHPELVCEPAVNALVAGWFWVEKGMNTHADAGDFKEVCRRWNGDATGDDQPRREDYFHRFKAALNPRMH
jgi:putative chitinase